MNIKPRIIEEELNCRIFGRITEKGVAILHEEDGEPLTRLPTDYPVWPVGSEFASDYEHPNGIILNVSDAVSLGIDIEE